MFQCDFLAVEDEGESAVVGGNEVLERVAIVLANVVLQIGEEVRVSVSHAAVVFDKLGIVELG